MKEVITRQVTVSGKGATRQQAFASALGQVQTTLLRETQQVLLRIEPQDVTVVDAHERCWTERFLFIFLPRQRHEFSVTLNITVNMVTLDTSKVNFTLI